MTLLTGKILCAIEVCVIFDKKERHSLWEKIIRKTGNWKDNWIPLQSYKQGYWTQLNAPIQALIAPIYLTFNFRSISHSLAAPINPYRQIPRTFYSFWSWGQKRRTIPHPLHSIDQYLWPKVNEWIKLWENITIRVVQRNNCLRSPLDDIELGTLRFRHSLLGRRLVESIYEF